MKLLHRLATALLTTLGILAIAISLALAAIGTALFGEEET